MQTFSRKDVYTGSYIVSFPKWMLYHQVLHRVYGVGSLPRLRASAQFAVFQIHLKFSQGLRVLPQTTSSSRLDDDSELVRAKRTSRRYIVEKRLDVRSNLVGY